jgi:hypothetical protein
MQNLLEKEKQDIQIKKTETETEIRAFEKSKVKNNELIEKKKELESKISILDNERKIIAKEKADLEVRVSEIGATLEKARHKESKFKSLRPANVLEWRSRNS